MAYVGSSKSGFQVSRALSTMGACRPHGCPVGYQIALSPSDEAGKKAGQAVKPLPDVWGKSSKRGVAVVNQVVPTRTVPHPK